MNKKKLDLIEKRLKIGEKRYGKQNMSSDGRDFLKESLEEALDCSVYLAGRIIEIKEKTNACLHVQDEKEEKNKENEEEKENYKEKS